MYSKEQIEYIKQNISIVDYIEQEIEPKLSSYYSAYPTHLGFKDFILCPLHVEDTPSMKIYKDTNSYYCFGCGAHGDVIKLHQEFYRVQMGITVGFNQAVRYLHDKFLKGVDLTVVASEGTVCAGRSVKQLGVKGNSKVKSLLEVELKPMDYIILGKQFDILYTKYEGNFDITLKLDELRSLMRQKLISKEELHNHLVSL